MHNPFWKIFFASFYEYFQIISLSSSALGAAVIPIFTAKLTSNTDNLGVVAFAIMCDIFIGLFTFTPLLLHFLTKRYVVNLYYNKGSQVWKKFIFFIPNLDFLDIHHGPLQFFLSKTCSSLQTGRCI